MPKIKLNITGKPKVASLYPLRGMTHVELRTQPACMTVGELGALLAKLPADLPVGAGIEDGVKLVWFNVGQPTENLQFEENDGCWDEDDDE